MISELCAELKNYFLANKGDDIHVGDYVIDDGVIVLDFLQNGQYFRIVGSTFNDGVYRYPASGLIDESFSGAVWAMAVPPSVIALSEEIDSWNEKYADVIGSPYSGESFGGYSYTKSSANAGDMGTKPYTWQTQFASKLNRWRRIREL